MSEDQKEPEMKGIGEDSDVGMCSNFDYEKCTKVKKFSTVLAAALLALVAISKVAVVTPDADTPAN